jgi:hypothetical protein
MDEKERERMNKERESGKRKRNERYFGRECREYPNANSRNEICKINGKKEEKWVLLAKKTS